MLPEHDAGSHACTDWETNLVLTPKGKVAAGYANALLVLSEHPALKGRIAHNELTSKVEVLDRLPWSQDAEQFPREWADCDDTWAAGWIQREYEFSASPDAVAKAVAAVAELRRYHPIREYLDRCLSRWDGKPRFHDLFVRYAGAGADEPHLVAGESLEPQVRLHRYLAAISQCFLIGAVARVFSPGCKHDCVVVLEGEQGALKSSLLRVLFEPWFIDEIASLGTKDANEQMRGIWCIELGELDAVLRSDPARTKAFLSRQTDRFRQSYGRRVMSYPRQNIFAGSTNCSDWNGDETGARRFWPVAVGTIDLDAARRDRDQLWGEAVHAFRQGERWWLVGEEEALAIEQQRARRRTDPWEPTIAEHLVGREITSVHAILELALDLDMLHRTQSAANRVARILSDLGWRRKQFRVSGVGMKRAWYYVRSRSTAAKPTGDTGAADAEPLRAESLSPVSPVPDVGAPRSTSTGCAPRRRVTL